MMKVICHICEFSKTFLSWDVIWDIKANLDRIRYLSTHRVSKIDNLIEQHQHIYNLINEGKALLEAMEAVRVHLYEIVLTSIPICLENAEWFNPEDVTALREEYKDKEFEKTQSQQ